MVTHKSAQKILDSLLKDFSVVHTITSLAHELGLSRIGVWKIIKRLEKEKLIEVLPIGAGKTSTFCIYLNWQNPLVEKNLALILAEDALAQQRWIANFRELEDKVEFLVLYGSILHSQKEANDIDLLCVVRKSKFVVIDETINRIQKTQLKKIHALCFTNDELKQEIKRQNKAIIDGFKKGVILFGHENFIRFISEVCRQ